MAICLYFRKGPDTQVPTSDPHAKNLRKGRVSLENQIYLVTFVTAKRKHRFINLFCARLMVNTLKNCTQAETLAFVIMPDHVHWMLQLKGDAKLSSIVQVVKSVSAHALNRQLERHGSIWQKGFHDHALRREEGIRHAARYIIANPVRAGLVESVRDYSHWDAVWV